MKVYKILADVNRFQYFLTEREEDWESLVMDGTSKAESWIPPLVYVYQPKLEKGDFYNFSNGILISSPEATEALRTQFEIAGELLPLPYGDKNFTLLNVTECIECLDEKTTEWVIGKTTGERISIKSYAFHSNRFSESDLFKIPQTCKTEILYVEGIKDYEDSFRYAVESNALRGLKFQEIWNSS